MENGAAMLARGRKMSRDSKARFALSSATGLGGDPEQSRLSSSAPDLLSVSGDSDIGLSKLFHPLMLCYINPFKF